MITHTDLRNEISKKLDKGGTIVWNGAKAKFHIVPAGKYKRLCAKENRWLVESSNSMIKNVLHGHPGWIMVDKTRQEAFNREFLAEGEPATTEDIQRVLFNLDIRFAKKLLADQLPSKMMVGFLKFSKDKRYALDTEERVEAALKDYLKNDFLAGSSGLDSWANGTWLESTGKNDPKKIIGLLKNYRSPLAGFAALKVDEAFNNGGLAAFNFEEKLAHAFTDDPENAAIIACLQEMPKMQFDSLVVQDNSANLLGLINEAIACNLSKDIPNILKYAIDNHLACRPGREVRAAIGEAMFDLHKKEWSGEIAAKHWKETSFETQEVLLSMSLIKNKFSALFCTHTGQCKFPELLYEAVTYVEKEARIEEVGAFIEKNSFGYGRGNDDGVLPLMDSLAAGNLAIHNLFNQSEELSVDKLMLLDTFLCHGLQGKMLSGQTGAEASLFKQFIIQKIVGNEDNDTVVMSKFLQALGHFASLASDLQALSNEAKKNSSANPGVGKLLVFCESMRQGLIGICEALYEKAVEKFRAQKDNSDDKALLEFLNFHIKFSPPLANLADMDVAKLCSSDGSIDGIDPALHEFATWKFNVDLPSPNSSKRNQARFNVLKLKTHILSMAQNNLLQKGGIPMLERIKKIKVDSTSAKWNAFFTLLEKHSNDLDRLGLDRSFAQTIANHLDRIFLSIENSRGKAIPSLDKIYASIDAAVTNEILEIGNSCIKIDALPETEDIVKDGDGPNRFSKAEKQRMKETMLRFGLHDAAALESLMLAARKADLQAFLVPFNRPFDLLQHLKAMTESCNEALAKFLKDIPESRHAAFLSEGRAIFMDMALLCSGMDGKAGKLREVMEGGSVQRMARLLGFRPPGKGGRLDPLQSGMLDMLASLETLLPPGKKNSLPPREAAASWKNSYLLELSEEELGFLQAIWKPQAISEGIMGECEPYMPLRLKNKILPPSKQEIAADLMLLCRRDHPPLTADEKKILLPFMQRMRLKGASLTVLNFIVSEADRLLVLGEKKLHSDPFAVWKAICGDRLSVFSRFDMGDFAKALEAHIEHKAFKLVRSINKDASLGETKKLVQSYAHNLISPRTMQRVLRPGAKLSIEDLHHKDFFSPSSGEVTRFSRGNRGLGDFLSSKKFLAVGIAGFRQNAIRSDPENNSILVNFFQEKISEEPIIEEVEKFFGSNEKQSQRIFELLSNHSIEKLHSVYLLMRGGPAEFNHKIPSFKLQKIESGTIECCIEYDSFFIGNYGEKMQLSFSVDTDGNCTLVSFDMCRPRTENIKKSMMQASLETTKKYMDDKRFMESLQTALKKKTVGHNPNEKEILNLKIACATKVRRYFESPHELPYLSPLDEMEAKIFIDKLLEDYADRLKQCESLPPKKFNFMLNNIFVEVALPNGKVGVELIGKERCHILVNKQKRSNFFSKESKPSQPGNLPDSFLVPGKANDIKDPPRPLSEEDEKKFPDLVGPSMAKLLAIRPAAKKEIKIPGKTSLPSMEKPKLLKKGVENPKPLKETKLSNKKISSYPAVPRKPKELLKEISGWTCNESGIVVHKGKAFNMKMESLMSTRKYLPPPPLPKENIQIQPIVYNFNDKRDQKAFHTLRLLNCKNPAKLLKPLNLYPNVHPSPIDIDQKDGVSCWWLSAFNFMLLNYGPEFIEGMIQWSNQKQAYNVRVGHYVYEVPFDPEKNGHLGSYAPWVRILAVALQMFLVDYSDSIIPLDGSHPGYPDMPSTDEDRKNAVQSLTTMHHSLSGMGDPLIAVRAFLGFQKKGMLYVEDDDNLYNLLSSKGLYQTKEKDLSKSLEGTMEIIETHLNKGEAMIFHSGSMVHWLTIIAKDPKNPKAVVVLDSLQKLYSLDISKQREFAIWGISKGSGEWNPELNA